MLAKRQGKGNFVQGVLADQIGAQTRQIAFGQLRKPLVKQNGDDAVEDAVTDEFEPLVMGSAMAAMGQRRVQQLLIAELVPERQFQLVSLPCQKKTPRNRCTN